MGNEGESLVGGKRIFPHKHCRETCQWGASMAQYADCTSDQEEPAVQKLVGARVGDKVQNVCFPNNLQVAIGSL